MGRIGGLLLLTVTTTLVMTILPFGFAEPLVMSQSNPLWSGTFSVPGYQTSGDSVTCGVESLQVQSGLVGQRLFGTVSSSQPMDFWVMSTANINAWSSWSAKGSSASHVCAEANPPAHLSAVQITSYSMDWTVPDSQTYYFVFWNIGSNPVSVTFSYWTQ